MKPMLWAALAATMALAPNLATAQEGGPQVVRRVRAPTPPPAFVGEQGTARLDLSSGAPVVEVTLGGKPFRFLIDTGAGGHGRIKPAIAEALGLTVTGEARAGDGSGNVQIRKRYGAPDLTVGGVVFKDLDLTELPEIPGRPTPWDGVLGLDLFASHLLTLDYAKGVMTLGRETLSGGVAYELGRGMVLPLKVGTTDLQATLDTGNSLAPLILPPEQATALASGPPRPLGKGRTAISSVEVQQADLTAPVSVGGVALPVKTVTWPSLGPVGNLGSLALVGMVVRIDQRSRRLEIAAATP